MSRDGNGQSGNGLRRFKRYPAYKDSGVEWLGNIPSHWDCNRLKHLSSEALKYGANESAELNDTTQPRFIRITDIDGDGRLRDETFRSLPEAVARPFLLREGDVLFARSGGTVGKTFLYQKSWGKACFAGYLIRFRADTSKCIAPFVWRFTKTAAYDNWLSSVFIQATIQNVSAEKYANFALSVPPIDEQERILRFLDRETKKIDALVVKLERLIGLLQEKRTALISHAVTKGLDPTVPMKDSGVEWLGQIPAHWDVKRLKYLVSRVGSGKTPKGGAEIYVEKGILFLRSQNIHFTGLRLNDVVHIDTQIDAEMACSRVLPNDVLLNITGASLGRCSLVPDNFPAANVNQHVCVIRPRKEKISPAFLHDCLSSRAVQRQIFSSENGTSREGLNFVQVSQLVLAMPRSKTEQCEIARSIRFRTAQLDKLITKVRDGIDKLREYRTALISAAVTGKIDVREETTSPKEV